MFQPKKLAVAVWIVAALMFVAMQRTGSLAHFIMLGEFPSLGLVILDILDSVMFAGPLVAVGAILFLVGEINIANAGSTPNIPARLPVRGFVIGLLICAVAEPINLWWSLEQTLTSGNKFVHEFLSRVVLGFTLKSLQDVALFGGLAAAVYFLGNLRDRSET